MSASFVTFQTFTDTDVAAEMANHLQANGIECRLENNRTFYDPSYANNSFGSDISLLLRSDDFVQARSVLEKYYAGAVDDVDSDYYLFSFSNAELTDIITHPDEWGFLDYQLAQKILRERGKTIDPEIVEHIKEQRNEKLARPETANRYWIYAGYFLALFGGLLAVIIGWTLAYLKKTLPDGRSIYTYREEDRNHGTRILLLSCISLLIWLAILHWL